MNDIQKEKARTIIQKLHNEIEMDELYPYGVPEIHKTIGEVIELLTELSPDPD